MGKERILSFEPVIDSHSKLLILGSMPGGKSLELNQYYGYKYNQFWRIIFILLQQDDPLDYSARLECLLANGIALWDVFQSCSREGSLDSHIKNEVINDFAILHRQYPGIKTVFFNGKKAYHSYQKKVGELYIELENQISLPSSSPAYTLPFSKKLTAWQKLLEVLCDK